MTTEVHLTLVIYIFFNDKIKNKKSILISGTYICMRLFSLSKIAITENELILLQSFKNFNVNVGKVKTSVTRKLILNIKQVAFLNDEFLI